MRERSSAQVVRGTTLEPPLPIYERGWREACEKVPIVKRRWGGGDYERTAEGLREGGGGLGEGGDWKKAVGKITRQRLMD